ncbi:MAG TPA: H-type lectin domain-containing protein [Planctomycetota bacterium]|nr:H-type lectin domain-containing protein [Planctomycetota bacterium]
MSSLVGGICTYILGTVTGLIGTILTDSQVLRVARHIVDEDALREVILRELADRIVPETSVLVGTHRRTEKGYDEKVEIAFGQVFIDPPQVYLALSGFGAPKSMAINDAYASVEEVTHSGATIVCTAAPEGDAWLSFTWIAVGKIRR